MTTSTKTSGGIIWRKGKKVILRPVEEADLPECQRWINDPLNNCFLLRTWPCSAAGQREWFERVSKTDPDRLTLAITTHDGTLIGNMSLVIKPEKQSAETGTLIGHHDYKGKGYGTDAKMLLLEYAFNWRNVRRAISPIITFNDRSQAYAKKCGYRFMARIEQEHFRFGRWNDEVRYVVFRDEWLPLWEQYREGLPYWDAYDKNL